MPPLAARTKRARPPSRGALEPSMPRTSEGPKEAYRPPSAHTAISTGSARSSGSRAADGKASCGLSEFHAPGMGAMGSFMNLRPTVCTTKTAASAEAGMSSVIKGTCDEPRAWLRSLFTELAQGAKAADPELLGRQLVFLYDGAALAASVDGDRNAPQAAKALAAQMLPLP
jgi:hypothetical protein